MNSTVSKGGRKLMAGSANDLVPPGDEPLSVTMNFSHISSISGACMNSTTYGSRPTLPNEKHLKRGEQKQLEVIEILKKNYGIVLPKACEERVIRAAPLFDSEIRVDLAMAKELPAHPRDSDVTRLVMDSDTVEQMHHVTRYRRELSLPDDVSELLHSRLSQWDEAELERGSELMGTIQKKATSVAETLRLIGDFGVSLDLVRSGDVDI